MAIVAAWVVPHAPLLVPGLRSVPSPVPPEIDPAGADIAVIVSPHGRTSGVYRRTEGSLTGFGVRGFERAATSAASTAEEVAGAWGVPVLDEPVDHGVLVPLWWLRTPLPVVGCALEEVTGFAPSPSYADIGSKSARLAQALSALAAHRNVCLVASAHLSAGLTAGAPLTELAGARNFDRRVLTALEHAPLDLLEIAPEEWEAAGSCGMGPLQVLATCHPRPLGTPHYEHPFGVGYVTAGGT